MGAFRFLTAGESHGPALGVTIEGVPAGLALTADDLAVDLARRQRGYGRGARQAIEQDRAEILGGVRHGADPRLADPAPRPQPRLGELDPGDGGRAARRRGGGRAPRAAAEGQQASDAGDPGPARSRRPRRRAQVRLQRRPQRPRARVGARDRGAGRRRRGRPGVPARARASRSGRSRAEVGGVAVDPANCTRSRDEADASPLRCPDPDAEARDDRPHRRGALGRRHGRRRLRGRRPRPADRARVVRPLGPAARRGPRRGGHEHQHRQGRRVRARLRADPALRLGRPRRHRGPGRRRPLGPPHEQRRAA